MNERGRSATRSPPTDHLYPPTLSPPPPATFRSSKLAVLIVVSLAIFVDLVVYGVVMPTLPARVVDQLGLDVSFVGILLAFYAIGLILITPLVSIYSDRFQNRKAPMLLGLVGLIATTLVFAYSQSFWGLAMARLGQGVSAGISWTIGFAMISDLYKPSELGNVMGYVLSANTAGFLVGPPLGGLLSDYVNPMAPYLFCTGLALLDMMGRLYIKPEMPRMASPDGDAEPLLNPESPSRSRNPSTVPPKAKSNSMLYFLSDPQVLVTCLGIIVGATVFSGIEPTLPVFLAKQYGLSASEIGLVWIGIVIPNMISGILSGRISDTHGRKSVTSVGLALFGLSSILLGCMASLWATILALLLFGFSSAIVLTPGLPEFADFAEEHGGTMYAQAYALYNVAYSIGMIIGPLIGGYLYQEIGHKGQLIVFGVLNLVCAPILAYFHHKRLAIPVEEPV